LQLEIWNKRTQNTSNYKNTKLHIARLNREPNKRIQKRNKKNKEMEMKVKE